VIFVGVSIAADYDAQQAVHLEDARAIFVVGVLFHRNVVLEYPEQPAVGIIDIIVTRSRAARRFGLANDAPGIVPQQAP
jgi:hypothetical protein